jgi:signal transduction histidine kinase
MDTTAAVDALNTTLTAMTSPRRLVCHYNPGMVVAAFAVSLLGAFTSTQLMCQARGTRNLSGVLIWTGLGSLVFGFCATWCLHFLGMLSCGFDVPIGLNTTWTILSAVLAVSFTFGALSTDLIQTHWRRLRRKKVTFQRHRSDTIDRHLGSDLETRQISEPLLDASQTLSRTWTSQDVVNDTVIGPPEDTHINHSRNESSSTDALLADHQADHIAFKSAAGLPTYEEVTLPGNVPLSNINHSDYNDANSGATSSTAESNTLTSLNNAQPGVDTAGTMSWESSPRDSAPSPASNPLLLALNATINGFTLANVIKGFVWSIALTNMHFMGVEALRIPDGFVALSLTRVILCASISWSVCCVGVILMAEMEVNIVQQLLFSVIAATGVAAVHFSGLSTALDLVSQANSNIGMYACSFWSTEAPSSNGGYPSALPVAIASVAILTCMASTGLLAHSATVARDKLAEVLYTKRRLWAAIAQKENAEAAAAARSEFIASASHEIRTPLHQLQGFTDLLSKSELAEEDRLLLHAIQHATKSLTMSKSRESISAKFANAASTVTSNVLDWSRLEKGEAICRPVLIDVRLTCEMIVHLLPNTDDNFDTELLVVVAPEVPTSIFVDETYLQRILMNLLSNSFKFTVAGYVMLFLSLQGGHLQVVVKDSGFGIPQSFLSQLFEPYKQVQARGAERGTGLGLSITKRLLERMQGSVTVESKHFEDQDIGTANSGSQFTLTIPIATSDHPPDSLYLNFFRSVRIVIMHDGKTRDIEALTAAWSSFGAEVSYTQVTADIQNHPDTIIWADLRFLQKNHAARSNILSQTRHLVLVPHKDRASLEKILGPAPSVNIVPIKKPLIWHRIVQIAMDARQIRSTPVLDKDDTLALKVAAIYHPANESNLQAPMAKKRTILLVEDNKVRRHSPLWKLCLLC